MAMLDENLLILAQEVVNIARDKSIYIATAESCTGGLISAYITAIPGAGDVFDCGFATYSEASKKLSIHVPDETIKNFGAVSTEVAMEMAMGACKVSSMATIAVSTTGIAGPSGGTEGTPVGLVCIGLYMDKHQKIYATKNYFKGDRNSVRMQAVEAALSTLKEELIKY